jgi:hypothetical protein
MAKKSDLIASIEALLSAAKSYDGIDFSADRPARLDLLGKVEALHYQLDDPSDAIFRQIMNVRYSNHLSLSPPGLLYCASNGLTGFVTITVFRNGRREHLAANGSSGEDTTARKHNGKRIGHQYTEKRRSTQYVLKDSRWDWYSQCSQRKRIRAHAILISIY